MRRDEQWNHAVALMMQGMLYHSAACALFNMISEKTLQENLLLLLLYFPLFFFSFVREKCGNFVIFMLLHAVTSGIILFLTPNFEMRLAMGCCMAFMAVQSIRLRLKPVYEREECPPIASVWLFLIVYWVAAEQKRMQLMQVGYYETFLFLILFAVYKSGKNTEDFLKSNEKIQNLPLRQIKSLNKMLVGVFILFLIAGMIGLQQLPMGKLLEGFIRVLQTILGGIISFLFSLIKKEAAVEQSEPIEQGEMPPMDVGEASLLIQILEEVIKTAIFLLVVIGVVYIIVKLLYQMYQRFYEQQVSVTDESEFLWGNIQVKERVGKIRRKKTGQAGGSTNQKIRRMYKKYITRQLGKKIAVPAFMTPTELEEFVAEQKTTGQERKAEVDSGQVRQRLEIYQKARYSQWECTKQEMDDMKQHIRVHR